MLAVIRTYRKAIIGALLLTFVSGLAFAAEATAPAAPVADPATIWATLWAFINSPLGSTVILGAAAWLLSKLWTAKPAWRVVFDQYHPLLMQAVKYAEKAIPDETPNAGLKRADLALKKVIELDDSITNHGTDAITQAITATHAQAEAHGNI